MSKTAIGVFLQFAFLLAGAALAHSKLVNGELIGATAYYLLYACCVLCVRDEFKEEEEEDDGN